MKHNFFNNITKIFLLAFFTLSNTSIATAQTSQITITPEKNSEIMNTINASVDRLDTAISNLTSQMEMESHTQKKITNTNNNIIRDLKQQTKDLQDTNEKLSHEIAIQKVEIENLKNTLSMYSDNIKKLEQQISTLQTTIQQKNTPSPTIINGNSTAILQSQTTTPIIIDDTDTTTNTNGTTDTPIQQSATENPSDLLLPTFAMHTSDQSSANNTTDEQEISPNKPQPYTDDETFEMALSTYRSKNYTDSAIQFGANIKAFPNGKNFYKNLLYLGKSMQKLDNKISACTAFAKIIHSKENIEAKIKDEAERGFDKLECNPQRPSSPTKKKK